MNILKSIIAASFPAILFVSILACGNQTGKETNSNNKKNASSLNSDKTIVAEYQKHKSGVITYDQVIDIHGNLSENQKAYAAFLPKEMKSTVELHFNNTFGRTINIKNDVKGKGDVQISMGNIPEKIFDITNKKSISMQEIMEKKYAVESTNPEVKSTDDSNIEITKETKLIQGFACKKVIINDAENTIVWFTNDIPISISPMGYIGLNGAILEIEHKSVSYICTNIAFKETDDTLYSINEDWRKITQEQANDLQEEYIESIK